MTIKVYHISRRKNRESIQKNGLIPKSKDFGIIQYTPSIFISIDSDDLGFDFVDYENVDCWEFNVDSTKIKKDPFSGSKNHFFIEYPIDASNIKLINSF